uniref:non-specific serine/threonine protein kinase n=1 Tax=Leersia perrieri TaxID=77586 RepID=A0A0D9V8T6_9ORYZ
MLAKISSLHTADTVTANQLLCDDQKLISPDGKFALGLCEMAICLFPSFILYMIILVLLSLHESPLHAADTLTTNQPLSGDQKLISQDGKFALGFFQPAAGGSSGKWYIGIWYNKIPVQTVVWVANRGTPIYDPASSNLTISADGNLALLVKNLKIPVWSTNITNSTSTNSTVAVILNTGNLVIRQDSNTSNAIWQSFDHLTDTWLPGSKLSRNKVTGVTKHLISWKEPSDPAPGMFSLQMDPSGANQYTLLWNNSMEYWASGNWTGNSFAGVPEMSPTSGDTTNSGYTFQFIDNAEEASFIYSVKDNELLTRNVIDVFGQTQSWVWVDAAQAWVLYFSKPKSKCSVYGICGAYSKCSENTVLSCTCLKGFSESPRNGNPGDRTEGCRRNVPLQCGGLAKVKDPDRFYMMSGVNNLPDNAQRKIATNVHDCELTCLNNCSCTAYHFNGTCLLWYNDIMDLQDDIDGMMDNIFIRLAASELTNSRRKKHWSIIGIIIIGLTVVSTGAAILYFLHVRRRICRIYRGDGSLVNFRYNDLQLITRNFSRRLGAGSFGSVFKGIIPDTTAIAVKRLEGLRQGEKEFRAEVSTIGNIHHINLIRLLGFCCRGSKRLLVYEYMANGSLDQHLFGKSHLTLSWSKRYEITIGIAKGLAYLHEGCRDCIMHCDIKPQNILLDASFVPKVADFGLAKLIGHDFSRVLTSMRGTLGYLAPEWLSGQAITSKADVFSYGMMLFEIISGKRNMEHGASTSSSGDFFPLLIAEELQKGEVHRLLDPKLAGDANPEELDRACKVACWCIQNQPDCRPSMREIIQILEGLKHVEMPPIPRKAKRKQQGFTGIQSKAVDKTLDLQLTGTTRTSTQGYPLHAVDTLTVKQSLSGDQKLISRGGKFALGFFQPAVNHSESPVWSTNITNDTTTSSPVAVLLDSGNLVVRHESNTSDVLWQSFDDFTDTWLPGNNRLSRNKKTGVIKRMISWKDRGDPAPGMFSIQLDPSGATQYILLWNNTSVYWASGNWTGNIYTGVPELSPSNSYPNSAYTFQFVDNDQETYFNYTVKSDAQLTRGVIDVSGLFQAWLSAVFMGCAANTVNVAKMLNYPNSWRLGDQTAGCRRNIPLQCSNNGSVNAQQDRFYVISGVKLPDMANPRDATNIVCLRITPIKNKEMVDSWDYHWCICSQFWSEHIMFPRRRTIGIKSGDGQLVTFKYNDLQFLTRNFSERLRVGSFGSVFKGILPDATTVAVKKLEGLRQGEKQFRAEVSTIGNIQHINLIQLLGFCSEGAKRLLVYEFMPNGSLDHHLFQSNSAILSWKKRYQIAIGIAKGLAYLHDGCRDCIIHCDIKPQNILLDMSFTPKVADFGMAKLLDRDFSRVLTTMRGTIGYLAPEWISGEPITTKADVFSYGMMLFEIISRKRNLKQAETSTEIFFPLLVARKLLQGESPTLLGSKLVDDVNLEELERACKVACWCIQDDASSRPTMAEVIQILEGLVDIEVPPAPRYLQVIAEGAGSKPYFPTSEESTLRCHGPENDGTSLSQMISWCILSMIILVLSLHESPLQAADTLTASQPLSGDQKLISQDGKFALGFFQPAAGESSSRWYIGIWYNKIPVQTVVWVANRDKPITDPYSSSLTILNDGNIALLVDHSGSPVWSTNIANNTIAGSPVAVLLDSGNLVVRHESNTSEVLWESFGDFTDTWLPGNNRLSRNKKTGVIKRMISWKDHGDPAPGMFSNQLDPSGAPQYILLWNSTSIYWASGNWTGNAYTGVPELSSTNSYPTSAYTFQFVDSDNEMYFTYSVNSDAQILTRAIIDVSGHFQAWIWADAAQTWQLFYQQPKAKCSVYGMCGAYSKCSENAESSCSCLKGFSERYPNSWRLGDQTAGCRRNLPLQGGNNSMVMAKQDRFYVVSSVKLPDRAHPKSATNVHDCESTCLNNCSCSAYSYNGTCLVWYGDLINLQDNIGELSNSIFIRLSASELPSSGTKKWWVVGAIIGVFVLSFGVSILYFLGRRRTIGINQGEGKLITFKYRDLQFLTRNFSERLGAGSFGSVFKGILPDATTVAVKKLEGLRQGEKQFRAEVSTIGNIQHINLIQLLGFCSEGAKRLLVYEFMPNGSLDHHLFQSNSAILSWKKRYQIAIGIAKGLAYLHDGCRDCIIHCDIKPQNILLDMSFTPKVADFGMAKLLDRDFSRVLTTMRGTIGYLAPEWISGEPITTKADVFSYGMMLFEIISRKRNLKQAETSTEIFFPLLVARKLLQGESPTLLGSELVDDLNLEELERAYKVACWCIQHDESSRPTMAEVIQILEGLVHIEVPPAPRFLQDLGEDVGSEAYRLTSEESA